MCRGISRNSGCLGLPLLPSEFVFQPSCDDLMMMMTNNANCVVFQWEKHQSHLPNDTEGTGAEDLKYADSCLLSDKNVVRSV
jgi:hypothetical protein